MFMDYNISSQYNIFDMWKIENLYFKHMFSERYSNHCQYVHVYIRYNKTSNHVLNTYFLIFIPICFPILIPSYN